MINNKFLSQPQIFFLILIGTYGSGIYHISDIIYESGRTAWLVPLSLLVITLPLLLIIFYISMKYNDKTFLQIVEIQWGKIIGRFFCLLYMIIQLFLSAFNLSISVGLAKNYILNATPIIIPMFIILLISTFIASSGMESIGRLALLLTPVFIFFYLCFMLLALINFDINDLKPFLDKSFHSIINSSYTFNSMACEVLFLGMIFVMNIKDKYMTLKTVFKSVLLTFIIIPVFTVISFIGVVGQEVAARMAYAGLDVSIYIGVGRYIQGAEVFIILTYIFLCFIKIAIYQYCIYVSSSQLVYGNKFGRKIIMYIFLVLTLLLTFTITNYNLTYIYNLKFLQKVAFPFATLLILLTLILMAIRNLLKKRSAQ